MLGPARPYDRRADAAGCEITQASASVAGSPRSLRRSTASVDALYVEMAYGPGRSVIREPSGCASPGRYFPVSQPPASGLNAW